MVIRSNISPKYLFRLIIVGLICSAGALWFLYDGLVTYPNQRVRAEEFIRFSEEHADLDEKDRLDKWNEYAKKQGWPTGNPGEPYKKYDINEQFFYAGGAGLIALGFLSRFVYMWPRWVECDDDTLRDKAGHETKLANIKELNKKRWDSKGIAFVHYEKDGKPERIRLDDFYYDLDTTRAILRHIEKNIDHAKITNGKPEPPLQLGQSEPPKPS